MDHERVGREERPVRSDDGGHAGRADLLLAVEEDLYVEAGLELPGPQQVEGCQEDRDRPLVVGRGAGEDAGAPGRSRAGGAPRCRPRATPRPPRAASRRAGTGPSAPTAPGSRAARRSGGRRGRSSARPGFPECSARTSGFPPFGRSRVRKPRRPNAASSHAAFRWMSAGTAESFGSERSSRYSGKVAAAAARRLASSSVRRASSPAAAGGARSAPTSAPKSEVTRSAVGVLMGHLRGRAGAGPPPGILHPAATAVRFTGSSGRHTLLPRPDVGANEGASRDPEHALPRLPPEGVRPAREGDAGARGCVACPRAESRSASPSGRMPSGSSRSSRTSSMPRRTALR